MTNLSHLSLFSRATNANDLSSWNVISGLLKPLFKPHVGAFNVQTFCHIGQQAFLAKTPESRSIDACCVARARIQDPSTVICLTLPYQHQESMRFTLLVPGDPIVTSRGLTGVGISLSSKAELSCPDWFSVDSSVCIAQLNGTVTNWKDRDTHHYLFTVSAYAPTDCSSDEADHECYRKLYNPVQKAKRSDVVMATGDFNVQVNWTRPKGT